MRKKQIQARVIQTQNGQKKIFLDSFHVIQAKFFGKINFIWKSICKILIILHLNYKNFKIHNLSLNFIINSKIPYNINIYRTSN